jgi:hypothetical protein
MSPRMNLSSGICGRLARFADSTSARILTWFTAGALVIAAIATLGGIRATTTLPVADITPELGRAFIVRPATSRWLVVPADDWLGRMQGAARLYEDGRELGPGRQVHQSIRDEANGLFALDHGYLRFAASDGSDPRSNGRTYTLNTAVNPGLIPWLIIALGLAAISVRFLASSIWSNVAPTVRPLSRASAILSAIFGTAVVVGVLMTSGTLGIEIRTPGLVSVCLVALSLFLLLPVLWPALRQDLRTAPDGWRQLRHALWAARALGAAMLLYGAVFATGLITIHDRIDDRAIGPGGGKMYVSALPAPPVGLGYQEFWRSPLVTPTRVTENGREFGLGNSVHSWIVELGGGRFSIFGGNLLFSTADNSDPRTNGRRYEVTTPLLPTSNLFLLALLLIGGSQLGLRQLDTRAADSPANIQQAHWLVVIAAFLLTIAAGAVLWRSRPDLYPERPLGGIVLWFVPFVVLVMALITIGRLRFTSIRLTSGAGIAAAFSATVLLAFASLAPLLDNLLLADTFGSIHYDGSQILSMIHANDSATYIASATQLVEGGRMDGIGSNRPINATMLAHGFWIGDANILAMLFLRATFMAFALVIATYEMAKTFGWGAAFVFGAFNTSFAAEFVQSALSEPNGLAWACFGIAVMLRAFRLHSFWLLVSAIGLFTIAMMARPGAMFSLPALIVFAWWERKYFKTSGTLAVTAAVIAMLIAWQLATYLNWSLDAPTRTLLSNFPHTLYGLASGGKGWLQITIDHPELNTPSAMLGAAIQKIWSEPTLILGFLWREFLDFWPFTFQLTKLDLFFALTVLGAVATLTTLRSIYARLLIVMVVSIWISAPIVMNDGSYRVFAASVPFLALMAVWPLILLIGMPPTANEQPPGDVRGQSRLRTLFGLSGLAAMAAILLLISSPLIFRRPAPEIMTRQLTPSCASGERSIMVHSSATTQALHIISDQESRSVVPYVRQSAFHRHLTLNAPKILADLGRIPAGSTVMQINEPRSAGTGSEIHLVFFLGSKQALPRNQIVEICADPIPGRFNDSLYVSRGLRVINRS